MTVKLGSMMTKVCFGAGVFLVALLDCLFCSIRVPLHT